MNAREEAGESGLGFVIGFFVAGLLAFWATIMYAIPAMLSASVLATGVCLLEFTSSGYLGRLGAVVITWFVVGMVVGLLLQRKGKGGYPFFLAVGAVWPLFVYEYLEYE